MQPQSPDPMRLMRVLASALAPLSALVHFPVSALVPAQKKANRLPAVVLLDSRLDQHSLLPAASL
jgi:hypothetical protein